MHPEYTFDAFVVSPSSKEAWSAAVAVANEPGRAYNPLFLYGPCGSGKTHLLHAIEHAMPHANVVRLPVTAFVSSIAKAIRADAMKAFEESLASIDALLLDDIRLLAGMPVMEREVLRQLESLAARGVQVVVTSDAFSPWSAAHAVEVGYPDAPARVEIARRFAAARGLSLSDDALRTVAEETTGSAAELRSVILRIAAEARLSA